MTFADPTHNLEQFGLTPGMHVADLGSGSGFYTIAAAKLLKDGGKVYSLEVQKELLTKIKSEAERNHLNNIEIIWANIEKLGGTKLRERSMDAAIISNVLFQIEDKRTFILEVKRILKPEGRVLFIDWSESYGGMGPSATHVVSKSNAEALFKAEGFSFERELSVGAHHYGIILKRNG